jgi:hypothetical protein
MRLETRSDQKGWFGREPMMLLERVPLPPSMRKEGYERRGSREREQPYTQC